MHLLIIKGLIRVVCNQITFYENDTMIKQLCINKHNTCLSRKLETGYLMTGNYSKTYFLHKHIIKASLCQGDYIHYPLSIIIHWIYNVLVPNHKQRHHSTRAKQRTFEKRNVQDLIYPVKLKTFASLTDVFFPFLISCVYFM